VHQVGPKDSGSQNVSFLALKAEPVGEVQRRVTDGKKFVAQIMFFSHKKSLNVKISKKSFHLSHHETNTSLIFHMWQVKIETLKKSNFQSNSTIIFST
jgi:hypothetical protein